MNISIIPCYQTTYKLKNMLKICCFMNAFKLVKTLLKPGQIFIRRQNLFCAKRFISAKKKKNTVSIAFSCKPLFVYFPNKQVRNFTYTLIFCIRTGPSLANPYFNILFVFTNTDIKKCFNLIFI